MVAIAGFADVEYVTGVMAAFTVAAYAVVADDCVCGCWLRSSVSAVACGCCSGRRTNASLAILRVFGLLHVISSRL